MIKPVCYFCEQELLDFGAILFSPPVNNSCVKHHVCQACYNWLKSKEGERSI